MMWIRGDKLGLILGFISIGLVCVLAKVQLNLAY